MASVYIHNGMPLSPRYRDPRTHTRTWSYESGLSPIPFPISEGMGGHLDAQEPLRGVPSRSPPRCESRRNQEPHNNVLVTHKNINKSILPAA